MDAGYRGTRDPLEPKGKMVSVKVILGGDGFSASHFFGYGGSRNWKRTHSSYAVVGAHTYSYGIVASIVGGHANSFFPSEKDMIIFPIFCRTFHGFSTTLLV